jgi:hypothetical protein
MSPQPPHFSRLLTSSCSVSMVTLKLDSTRKHRAGAKLPRGGPRQDRRHAGPVGHHQQQTVQPVPTGQHAEGPAGRQFRQGDQQQHAVSVQHAVEGLAELVQPHRLTLEARGVVLLFHHRVLHVRVEFFQLGAHRQRYDFFLLVVQI